MLDVNYDSICTGCILSVGWSCQWRLEPLRNKTDIEIRSSFLKCLLDTFKNKEKTVIWIEAKTPVPWLGGISTL